VAVHVDSCRSRGARRRRRTVSAWNPRPVVEGSRGAGGVGRGDVNRRGALARRGRLRHRSGAVARVGAARRDYVGAGCAPTVRDRSRRRGAAYVVLEQHGDGEHHHSDSCRAFRGPAPRSVGHRRARRVHVFTRIYPRERRADHDHSVFVRLLLDSRYGEGGNPDDDCRGGMRRGNAIRRAEAIP